MSPAFSCSKPDCSARFPHDLILVYPLLCRVPVPAGARVYVHAGAWDGQPQHALERLQGLRDGMGAQRYGALQLTGQHGVADESCEQSDLSTPKVDTVRAAGPLKLAAMIQRCSSQAIHVRDCAGAYVMGNLCLKQGQEAITCSSAALYGNVDIFT